MAPSKSLSWALGMPAPLWLWGRNHPCSNILAAPPIHIFPLLLPSLKDFDSWALSVCLETCLAAWMKKKSTWSFLAQSGREKGACSVTSIAPWAVLRQLRPHSPNPSKSTQPQGWDCSASIISGNDGPLSQRQPKLPHVLSLALPCTQGMNRGYLWADSQKDCVSLTFAKVVHFVQSWREGAKQSKSSREELFRQGNWCRAV